MYNAWCRAKRDANIIKTIREMKGEFTSRDLFNSLDRLTRNHVTQYELGGIMRLMTSDGFAEVVGKDENGKNIYRAVVE